MPEGDTVYKLAHYLRSELEGCDIAAGMARAAETIDLAGNRIGTVFAQGKHLFIELDNERCLRSHLGMHGSWHRYCADEPWQKPRRQASIILDMGISVFVCFNASQVEILRRTGVRRRILDIVLGPDLLDDQVDYTQILARARDLLEGDTPVLDVLLDQRVACGLGNVYKSEVLFLECCHPSTSLDCLADDRLLRMYRQARRLLRRNTGSGPRITRWSKGDPGRLWVYGRRGQPCLRCDDVIHSTKLGKGQRSTYWCPTCQPAGS